MKNAERKKLREDLTALGTAPHRGLFYRNIDALNQHAPLSVFRSELFGGRYNRARLYELDSFGALYLSDTPDNGLREVGYYVNGVTQALAPRMLLSVEANLQRVVDLRPTEAHAALGYAVEDLTRRGWERAQKRGRTLTQEIGAAAKDLGIEALLVPSAQVAGAHNLVVIIDNLRTDSELRIYVGGPDGQTRSSRDRLVGRVQP